MAVQDLLNACLVTEIKQLKGALSCHGVFIRTVLCSLGFTMYIKVSIWSVFSAIVLYLQCTRLKLIHSQFVATHFHPFKFFTFSCVRT